jgi:hypothetical protein
MSEAVGAPELMAVGLQPRLTDVEDTYGALANEPRVRSVFNLLDRREESMNNIFYIIGVIVVVLFVLGYFGLR